jgi:bifunctional non-homologous end joining protein LigD
VADEKLKRYRAKRDFSITGEPAAGSGPPGNRFVIQRHDASHLHFDFRLEIGGVLKSWALPKGPPTEPKEKRLAVATEDHPLDYADFEGTIPAGQYGAGTVRIWDNGTFEPVHNTQAERELEEGKFTFSLSGRRLSGRFSLVKTHFSPKSWLLIASDDVTTAEPQGPQGRRAPMPGRIKPMLAVLVDKPFTDDGWVFEVKWDGVRATAFLKDGKLRFISRNQHDLTPLFPELQAGAGQINAVEAVIDGEIVTLGPDGRSDFQKLQSRLGLARTTDIDSLAGRVPTLYYAFDLIYVDGRDLKDLPLVDRRQLLAQTLEQGDGRIRLSDYVDREGEVFFELAKERGLEGIIAKRKDSRYEEKRSSNWRKIKTVRTQDCVVCGYTQPKGGRRYFGSLILGLYSGGRLIYVGHAGTGFDDPLLKAMFEKMQPLVSDNPPFDQPPEITGAVWLEPTLVCEVKFTEWTREGYLRHPSFVALREDKEPSDCVRENPIKPTALTVAPGPANQEVRIHERPLKLTNLNKPFWPERQITKRDLIEHYNLVSELLLPHLRDRPLVMKRYPDGIEGFHFWQKDAPKELPGWVETQVIREGDHDNRYILANDKATLIYVANLGSIDLNPWSSRRGSLDSPDWLIVDLDPFETTFEAVVETALVCRRILEEIGLKGYPKTSGATGLHILVPLEPIYNYRDVRQLGEIVARLAVSMAPRTATVEPDIKNRRGKVYVDWLQNVRGKTIASVYSIRPEKEATVSIPLSWDEVNDRLRPEQFTISNLAQRLDKVGDLFKPVLRHKQRIEAALERLEGGL